MLISTILPLSKYFYFLVSADRILVGSTGWSGTHYTDQADLELVMFLSVSITGVWQHTGPYCLLKLYNPKRPFHQ